MSEIFDQITSSPMFGVALCIVTFAAGVALNKKLRSPIVNPLLIAIGLTIAVLEVFRIPLENFDKGGDVVSMFLGPATAALALSIYRQLELLKKNFLPIFLFFLAGCVTSMGSVYLLCRLFGLDDSLTASLLPKSVTTPIAMELSEQAGGYLSGEKIPYAQKVRTLPLSHEMFENDSLLFDGLRSRRITLLHGEKEVVTVDFAPFDHLLLWTKPGAPYLCIEPWNGLPDSADSDGDLSRKAGILCVGAGQEIKMRHSITFHA